MELSINKKGQFGNVFLVVAIIFAVAIFFIILAYTFSKIAPKINEALSDAATPEAGSNVTLILDKTATAITRINVLFPLLIAGLFGFLLISALIFRSHPAFLFIGLIILAVVLLLAAIYSNVYEELTSDETFEDVVGDFNIMDLFLENLPLIVFIAFVAIALVLWSRTGGSPTGY